MCSTCGSRMSSKSDRSPSCWSVTKPPVPRSPRGRRAGCRSATLWWRSNFTWSARLPSVLTGSAISSKTRADAPKRVAQEDRQAATLAHSSGRPSETLRWRPRTTRGRSQGRRLVRAQSRLPTRPAFCSGLSSHSTKKVPVPFAGSNIDTTAHRDRRRSGCRGPDWLSTYSAQVVGSATPRGSPNDFSASSTVLTMYRTTGFGV